MAQDIRLGVLDQIPIRDGGTAATAINETFELAETTDRLGYSATGWPSITTPVRWHAPRPRC